MLSMILALISGESTSPTQTPCMTSKSGVPSQLSAGLSLGAALLVILSVVSVQCCRSKESVENPMHKGLLDK